MDFWLVTPCSFGERQTFRRNISPPFLGLKTNPSKEPTEAGSKLVNAVTTNIHVNRKARRLEGNIGKYFVVGGVKA
jgi:hypothetical protein